MQPTPHRNETRRVLDGLIDSLVGDGSRPASTGPGSPAGGRGSRPTSVVSAGQLSSENIETGTTVTRPWSAVERETQTLSLAPLTTVFEFDGEPKNNEIITYSKGVQTADSQWTPPKSRAAGSGVGEGREPVEDVKDGKETESEADSTGRRNPAEFEERDGR